MKFFKIPKAPKTTLLYTTTVQILLKNATNAKESVEAEPFVVKINIEYTSNARDFLNLKLNILKNKDENAVYECQQWVNDLNDGKDNLSLNSKRPAILNDTNTLTSRFDNSIPSTDSKQPTYCYY